MRLTPRQRDTARLLALGLRPAQVAKRLHVSVLTVQSHAHAIALKLPNPYGAPPSRLVAVWAARNPQVIA